MNVARNEARYHLDLLRAIARGEALPGSHEAGHEPDFLEARENLGDWLALGNLTLKDVGSSDSEMGDLCALAAEQGLIPPPPTTDVWGDPI